MFGVLWIIFSDRILGIVITDPHAYQNFQTYKGLFYVLATALFLLLLVRREFLIRDRVERALKASLKKESELSRELHHRVKNNLQLVRSLLNLQREVVRTGDHGVEVDELLRRLSIRILIPSLFHQKIFEMQNNSIVDLGSYLLEIVGTYRMEYNLKCEACSFRIDFEKMPIQASRAVSAGIIVSELLLNVVNHAAPAPGEKLEVALKGRNENGLLRIVVQDNGTEYNLENQKKGLGFTLIEAMIQQLKGDLRIESDGKTRVEISIPSTSLTGNEGVREKKLE